MTQTHARSYESSFRRWTPAIVFLPYVGTALAFGSLAYLPFRPVYGWMLFIGFLITNFGIEGGFHRLFSHRAYAVPAAVRLLIGVAGSLAMEGPLYYWVGNHVRHHVHSDGEQDPHSPHAYPGLRGLWHAYNGWMLSLDLPASYRFVPNWITSDPVSRFVNRMFPLWAALSLAIPAAIGGLVEGSWQGAVGGLLWGGFARILLTFQSAFLVNTLGHVIGSRPMKTRDLSTNIAALSLFSLGGSWHNHHHAFPASASTGLAWWRLDPSYWIIRSLALIGLANSVRVPTAEQIAVRRVTAEGLRESMQSELSS